jgi:hypothetical protein
MPSPKWRKSLKEVDLIAVIGFGLGLAWAVNALANPQDCWLFLRGAVFIWAMFALVSLAAARPIATIPDKKRDLLIGASILLYLLWPSIVEWRLQWPWWTTYG